MWMVEQWVPRFNAFTTGNPIFGTNPLEFSIGRDFGALKGLRAPRDKPDQALLATKRSYL